MMQLVTTVIIILLVEASFRKDVIGIAKRFGLLV